MIQLTCGETKCQNMCEIIQHNRYIYVKMTKYLSWPVLIITYKRKSDTKFTFFFFTF